MDPEAIYSLFAALALPIGGVWALLQWRDAVAQRRRELRWRQAEAAWKLLDYIFEDQEAAAALRLIDGENAVLDVGSAEPREVTTKDAERALAYVDGDDTSEADRRLRHSFDCVLYAFERMRGAIESGYALEEDLRIPTSYYAEGIRRRIPLLLDYARRVHYAETAAMVERLASPAPAPTGPLHRQQGTGR